VDSPKFPGSRKRHLAPNFQWHRENRFCYRLLSENLVHLLPHLLTSGRFEVAHRAFHVRVSEPLLHGAEVNGCPHRPRRKCCPELVKPEVSFWSFARSAHAFRQSRKSSFGLHPAVGNTRPQDLSDFAFALKHAVWHLSTMAYSNEQEYRFLEAHPIDQPVPGVKIRYRPYSVIR
jgi:hypothetical protein